MRTFINFSTRTITVLLLLITLGLFGLSWVFEQAEASSAVDVSLSPNNLMTESDVMPNDDILSTMDLTVNQRMRTMISGSTSCQSTGVLVNLTQALLGCHDAVEVPR